MIGPFFNREMSKNPMARAGIHPLPRPFFIIFMIISQGTVSFNPIRAPRIKIRGVTTYLRICVMVC